MWRSGRRCEVLLWMEVRSWERNVIGTKMRNEIRKIEGSILMNFKS